MIAQHNLDAATLKAPADGTVTAVNGAVGEYLAPSSGTTAALEARLTSSGTAINNVVQRVSAALGLAMLSAMVTAQQFQLRADQAAVMPASDPRFAHLPPLAGYPLNVQAAVGAVVSSYTNAFLITSALTLAAAFGALTMRSGPAPKRSGHSAAALGD